MTYELVSSKQLIGKILRDTRITEAAYINDIKEWLGELLRKVSGTRQLQFMTKVSKVCFNKTRVPYGIMVLDGISYNGNRLPFRNIDAIPHGAATVTQGYLQFNTEAEVETPLQPDAYKDAWTYITTVDTGNWYSLEPGYIVTSMRDADIKIFYRTMPHDGEGLPMFPDNPDLHEAAYWFARHKLIGTGWLDPVYGRDDRICFERYNQYLGSAASSMDNVTPDMDLSIAEDFNRFYPDTDKWGSFDTIRSQQELL